MHELDPYTSNLLQISDQIAEISRRKRARAIAGEPRNESDEQLLIELTAKLNRPRYASTQNQRPDQATA